MFDSSISFNSRFFFYYCFYSFVLFFCEFKFGDFQIFALRCNFCRCRFDRFFFVLSSHFYCFSVSFFLSSPLLFKLFSQTRDLAWPCVCVTTATFRTHARSIDREIDPVYLASEAFASLVITSPFIAKESHSPILIPLLPSVYIHGNIRGIFMR